MNYLKGGLETLIDRGHIIMYSHSVCAMFSSIDEFIWSRRQVLSCRVGNNNGGGLNKVP